MALRSVQTIQNIHLFLALLISSTLLLAISANTKYLTPVETAIRWFAQPIVYIAQLPANAKEAAGSYVVSMDELHDRNDQLLKEVSRLNATMADLAQARTTIAELRDALGYVNEHRRNQVLSEIVQVNPNRQRLEVIINVGDKQGIEIDSGVLDPWGVYGRTVEVFPNTARVLLLNDERHATPVLVSRTRQYFIASGNGPDEPLTLDNVNLSSDIQVGDAVVTSGLGGVFPEGLVVGVVETVTDIVSESIKRVTVTPSAQLTAKSYLHVISSAEQP
ncbi:MAG: rod shape-determining protein MreC [Gammaproteobacteria bacterium]|nr:rod shape-determining protein MreC [Gammaproteobacteria bacterium]